jgi:hypothetical protein
MLRYRIARNPKGRYVVVATPMMMVPNGETYAARDEAQHTADRLNQLQSQVSERESRQLCVR